MPARKKISRKGSKKQVKSAFGRKRRSTKSESINKYIPMDVSIKMYFKDPFRKSAKAHWVSIPGLEKLKIELGQQWYKRLILERFIKLIVIHGIQSCVRACYYGQIPSWFKQRLTYSSNDKVVDDYWTKAKRVIACFRLFSVEDAGFLLTDRSILTAKTVNQLKFRSPEDISSECRFRSPIYNDVYSLLGMIEANIGNASSSVNGALSESQMNCKQIVGRMKEMIEKLLSGDIQVIIPYGATVSQADLVQEMVNRIQSVQIMRANQALKARGETDLIADTIMNQARLPTGSGRKHPTPVSVRQPTPVRKPTPSPIGRPSGVPIGTTNPIAAGHEAIQKSKGILSRLNKFKRGAFGSAWDPTTVSMTGFVKPYRVSAMESYTGMTPSAYRSHINSRTGSPTGSGGRLAKANNYYGSYRLGEMLNPSSRFGRRRALHDEDDDEDVVRKTRKTRKSRKVAKKSRKVTKKSRKSRKVAKKSTSKFGRKTRGTRSKNSTRKTKSTRARKVVRSSKKTGFGSFFF